jgi:hypothetical protein
MASVRLAKSIPRAYRGSIIIAAERHRQQLVEHPATDGGG